MTEAPEVDTDRLREAIHDQLEHEGGRLIKVIAVTSPGARCCPGGERSPGRFEAGDTQLEPGFHGIADGIRRDGVDDEDRRFHARASKGQPFVQGCHHELVRAAGHGGPGSHLEAVAIGIGLDQDPKARIG